jgi:hypothetical protein
MCNYNKIFKSVFKNWNDEHYIENLNKNHIMGYGENSPKIVPSVFGWGQENGLINKDNVELVHAPNNGYQGYKIMGDPFTLKCYELYTPWYKKFWKLICESCGKYWVPIMLGSVTYNLLYEYFPKMISWFL